MSAEDRLAIQELAYQYAHYIDSFDPDNWAQIFTPDAILDETAFFPDALFIGRGAIRAYGEKISRNVDQLVHLITNHIISDLTPGTARGTAVAIVQTMRKTGEHLRFYVKYEDEYVKVGDRWLIAKKLLRASLPPEKVTAA
ncbi:nuclear transport factor 2 family protein [Sphingobium sp.]|uniref:nuclear transport factor 2 family protein n=1 Tax=Sphingobium sp. TaxID=1912891 RepID=UPI002C1CCA10|nr:nuclear transport factor 2 family protein [Sphingobium sp.]HUD90498.1 nuclear transport factor 2 family protein [Sphingobium sp.]